MSRAHRPVALLPAGFFLLRTPYLPVDTLLELTGDSAWRATDAGSEALRAALAADRVNTHRRLRELVDQPAVREALYVASPDLEGRLHAWYDEPDSKAGRRIERALLRYVVRMSARATPFGLFAGHSTGTVGPATSLQLAAHGDYRRAVGLAIAYLRAVGEAVERDPATRERLRFLPNTSCYTTRGALRYTEVRLVGGARGYNLVSAPMTPYLQAALDAAANGERIDEIAAAVRAAAEPPGSTDPAVTMAEARAYIIDLIDSQILVGDLVPAATGLDPLDGLLGALAGLDNGDAQIQGTDNQGADGRARVVLGQAAGILTDIATAPPGVPTERYREVVTALAALGVPAPSAHPFRVGLVKPATATLSAAVLDDLAAGVRLLHRIGGAPRRDGLADFRSAFRARYGDCEVPLGEALDPESGVGLAWKGAARAPAPALAGLPFPRPDRSDPVGLADGAYMGPREHLLLRWVTEAAAAGGALALDEDRVAALAACTPTPGPLPRSFSVTASVLANDDAAVAAGDYRVLLTSVAGPAAAPIGRFCRDDPNLTERLRELLRAEEAAHPDDVLAEVVYLPEDRIADVVVRPLLREFEIPYLAHSGVPAECQITLADLLVSLDGERVVLRSRRLSRRVVPRLSAAHNFFGPRNVATYQFLCALQEQHNAAGLSFSFGGLDRAPYLPRVTCGRLVLSRARWVLGPGDLAALRRRDAVEAFLAVQELRDRLRLPRWVAVTDNDNLLPVDLDSGTSVDVGLDLLRDRQEAVLTELCLDRADLLACGPEGRYWHELVVPFVVPSPPESGLHRARGPSATSVSRLAPPGSDWLYARLYTTPLSTDRLLAGLVQPLMADLTTRRIVDKWFFLRYADPEPHLRLRLHGEPAQLLANALPALLAAAGAQVTAGQVHRIQLDTYERELSRYGGPTGLDIAERAFHADSVAVIGMLAALDGTEGGTGARGDGSLGDGGAAETDRWRWALLGVDRLLSDLGLDLLARLAIIEAERDSLGAELGVDVALRRALGERFRRERSALEWMLSAEASRDSTPFVAEGLSQLKLRSVALRPVAADLAVAFNDGRLTRSIPDIAASLAHMHVNRLLHTATRQHEFVLHDQLSRLYRSVSARSVPAR